MSKQQHKNSSRPWQLLLLLALSLGLVNVLAQRFFVRIDLTKDQRYSIHQATKQLIGELESDLGVTIYLAGDLPIGFRQLQRATKELLAEFKAHTTYPIHCQIIDINKVPIQERKAIVKNLAAKGIQPTNLSIQKQGQRTEKLIYPGALLAYQGQEIGVMLLKGNQLTAPAQMISQSMENLEYELTQGLVKLVKKAPIKLGFVKGHGQPDEKRLHGFFRAMREQYAVHEIHLTKACNLSAYQALFIVKPQQAFSEAEKYLLDQYIMQGGKVLFFIDQLRIDMNNLRSGQSFALPINLNLDDQLFRYGIRINHDLIQDLHAGVYPIIVGKMGNQPQVRLLNWPFFPILTTFANHLITKNLNPIYAQFVSSLDTVKADAVTKTPLVCTSKYSRRLGVPVHVDLASLSQEPQPSLYNQGPLPVVYLLEGQFSSLYKNRLPPLGFEEAQFIPTSHPTKILVAASSSLLLNAIEPRQNQPLAWGYDPFLRQHFANDDFVLSTLAYMLREDGLINTKRKMLKLRYLDKVKLAENRLAWQLINISIPLLVLLLIGILWTNIYKQIYTRF